MKEQSSRWNFILVIKGSIVLLFYSAEQGWVRPSIEEGLPQFGVWISCDALVPALWILPSMSKWLGRAQLHTAPIHWLEQRASQKGENKWHPFKDGSKLHPLPQPRAKEELCPKVSETLDLLGLLTGWCHLLTNLYSGLCLRAQSNPLPTHKSCTTLTALISLKGGQPLTVDTVISV